MAHDVLCDYRPAKFFSGECICELVVGIRKDQIERIGLDYGETRKIYERFHYLQVDEDGCVIPRDKEKLRKVLLDGEQ